MTIRKHTLLCLVFLVGLATTVLAQNNSGTAGTIATSGQSVNIGNPHGVLHLSVEVIPHGGPSTLVVAISGCMRAGTCSDPIATSNEATANVIAVAPATPYDYFLVTATFSGGTSPSVTVNYLLGAN
jgi:hypothetical protein